MFWIPCGSAEYPASTYRYDKRRVIEIRTDFLFEPKFIISAILAVVVEAALVASLVFLINASPVDIQREEYITINLNMMSQTQPEQIEKPAEPIPDPVMPEEQKPVEQNKQPDALLEALKTFQPQQPKTEIEGVTSGLKTLEVPETDRSAPESIFEQNTIDFNRIQTAPVKRKINSATLFSEKDLSSTNNPIDTSRIYNLNELQQFDIPNLDHVKNALIEDYQQLLNKKNIRVENVSGTVTVELVLGKSSQTNVTILSAASPELANLVLKNLKLLYLAENLNPLTLKVEVAFSAK
ncbi:MAG TPA: hypothetical protein PLO84_13365 [Thermotogota bacterium]|nr:hypothetical protein [Thermotogota bacterium]